MKRNKPSPKKDTTKSPIVLLEGNYQLAKVEDIQIFNRQQLMSFAVKYCKFYGILYDFKTQINVGRDELLNFSENLIKQVDSASTASRSCISKKLKMSSSNAKLKMFDKQKSTFAQWYNYEFKIFIRLINETDAEKKVLHLYRGLECGSPEAQRWSALDEEYLKPSSTPKYDFDAMVSKLKTFVDGSFEVNNSTQELLSLRCDGEDGAAIHAYTQKCSELCSRICPEADKRKQPPIKEFMIQAVISGLPSSLVNNFRLKQPTIESPDAIISELQNIAGSAQNENSVYRFTKTTVEKQGATDDFDGKCWTCGGSGHKSSVCPSKKKRPEKSSRGRGRGRGGHQSGL